MPVPAQATLFNESVANGVTTSFPYQFMIASADDLTVELDGVATTTGFTVTDVGDVNGGSVVFSVAPANGVKVLRYLDSELNRTEDYQQFGDFNAETVDREFDRLWLAVQSLALKLGLCLRLPISSYSGELPSPAANNVIGWNEDGTGFKNYAPVDNTLLSVSLGSPLGSGLIGFIQAGAGAVATDVQEVLRRTVSVKDFGAVGDGVTDDTAAIQDAINYVRTTGKTLFGSAGDSYRITAKLRTQTTGVFAPVTFDLAGAEIVVDFDSDDGFLIEGGSNRQTIKNLKIRASATYAQSGAYSATAVGVRVLNARVDLQCIASQFKGEGVLIESTASNSNTSTYDTYSSQCGRGVLVTGAFDDISVCQARFRAYGNLKEGVRVADTSAMRQWTCWIWSEGNWTSDPNNAANFGVYIGKATGCDFWIYCEQTGLASEIYASPTLTPYTSIRSARQNKDVITGTAVSVEGKDLTQIDYNVSSGAGRASTPARFVGKMSRTSTAGEYVRVPFVGANDIPHGYVRGELLGMHLDAPGGNNSVSANDAYVSLGGPSSLAVRRVFSGSQSLSTGSPSATITLAALSASRSCVGRISISGRSGSGAGQRIYMADFYISGTTLTINTPVVDVSPSTPPVITFSVVGSNLQIALSYSAGTWGSSYNFSYSIDLVWA